MVTKYEVKKINVETDHGINALSIYNNKVDQYSETLKAFNTLEEAVEFYNKTPVEVRKMGNYYLHTCKVLEINEYNDDDELIGGGDWWLYAFPDKEETI